MIGLDLRDIMESRGDWWMRWESEGKEVGGRWLERKSRSYSEGNV